MDDLKIGTKFYSWEEFDTCFKACTKHVSSVYTITDSKSIASANKNLKSGVKPLPVVLKYRYVRFGCKHFGAYVSASSGVRPNQSTYKMGCESTIMLSLNKEEECLVIREISVEHNHPISAEIYKSYPESRRLADDKLFAKESVFTKEAIVERWRIQQTGSCSESNGKSKMPVLNKCKMPAGKLLNRQEKFKQMMQVCTEISSVCSEHSMERFTQEYNFLQKLLGDLKSLKDCSLHELNDVTAYAATLPSPSEIKADENMEPNHLQLTGKSTATVQGMKSPFKLPSNVIIRGRSKGFNSPVSGFKRKRNAARDSGSQKNAKCVLVPEVPTSDSTLSVVIMNRIIKFMNTHDAGITTLLQLAARMTLPKTTPATTAACKGTDPAFRLLISVVNHAEVFYKFIREQMVTKSSVLQASASKNVDAFSIVASVCVLAMKLTLRPTDLFPMVLPLPNCCEKKLRISGIDFASDDLNTLKDDNWLNDKIIEAFLRLLSQEVNTGAKNTVLVLSPHLFNQWERCFKEPNEDFTWTFSECKFRAYKWIMMGLNSCNHWVLLAADVAGRVLVILDSRPHEDRKRVLLKHWVEFLNRRAETQGEFAEGWKTSPLQSRLQADDSNCGVFVLMNAESLLLNGQPQNLEHKFIPDYRYYIAAKLCNKAKSETICDTIRCKTPGKSSWIQCQVCTSWFHCACIGRRKPPIFFICYYCK